MVLPWAVACALVIGAFYLVDRRAFALETVEESDGDPARPGAPGTAAATGGARVPLSLEGMINLPLLVVVIGVRRMRPRGVGMGPSMATAKDAGGAALVPHAVAPAESPTPKEIG